MCFVTQALEEAKGGVVPIEGKGLAVLDEVDGFLLLGQTDEKGRLDPLGQESLEGSAKLTAAPINHDKLRQRLPFFLKPSIPTANDLLHGAEIVVAHERLDLKASILTAVRLAAAKVHHGGDYVGAGDVRNIEAFHDVRTFFHAESLLKRLDSLLRLPCHERVETHKAAGPVERFLQRPGDVAEFGGFLVLLLFGGLLHLSLQVLEPFPGFSIQEFGGLADAFGVLVFGHQVRVAVDFLTDVVVELPAAIGLAQGSGVTEEDAVLLSHLGKGLAEHAGVRKGSEVAGAAVVAIPCQAELGEFAVEVELDHEETLVVREVGIVSGAVFLDQASFEQEGFCLRTHGQYVEIGNEVEHGPDFGLLDDLLARRLKVGRDALLEVFGLADIERTPKTIFHQVHAWCMGYMPQFFFQICRGMTWHFRKTTYSKSVTSFSQPWYFGLQDTATPDKVFGMKRAEVINLGDELLLGIRDNAHLTYLGAQLAGTGIAICRNQVVRDDPDEIRYAFASAWATSDIVFTTGGLGPTVDDVTREAIASALGSTLEFCPDVEMAIRERFARMGRTVSDNNLRQAYRLAGAEVIPNRHGTAPGLWYEADGKILVMLPGPTNELRPMLEAEVIPRLKQLGLIQEELPRLQIRTFGLAESRVEEAIAPLLEPVRNHVQVAFCAHSGIIDVRLSALHPGLTQKALEKLGKACREKLGDDYVCQCNVSLERIVIERLRALERTLSVAESCTGGLLANAFTDVPGASKVFAGGVVCYNNDAKTELLGVPETILRQHGAVSAETAVAMATGAAERFGTEYALSITGFAGPGGGTQEHPVGTIFLGFCAPMGAWSRKVVYPGDRLTIKERAVNTALDWTRRKLGKYLVHDLIHSMPDQLRVIEGGRK